eukprot:358717-Pleurochrysis_carterae.AAC.1
MEVNSTLVRDYGSSITHIGPNIYNVDLFHKVVVRAAEQQATLKVIVWKHSSIMLDLLILVRGMELQLFSQHALVTALGTPHPLPVAVCVIPAFFAAYPHCCIQHGSECGTSPSRVRGAAGTTQSRAWSVAQCQTAPPRWRRSEPALQLTRVCLYDPRSLSANSLKSLLLKGTSQSAALGAGCFELF